jgi:hypothetical protein
MARYVLNVNTKLQLNQAEVDKIARQFNKAFSRGDVSDQFTNREQKALQSLRRELDKIDRVSSKIGPNLTSGLKKQIGLLEALVKSGDPRRFEKFALTLNEIKAGFREATQEADKLAKAAENAAQRASDAASLRRTRSSRQERRNQLRDEARERLRSLSDTIQKSKLPSAQQQQLLSPFAGAAAGAGSKAGRQRIRDTIRDTKRQFKDLQAL